MLWYDEGVKRLWLYYLYLIVIWGAFRYFVDLPEVIEELWFKPVLWLVPLFWWNLALKENVEMFGKKWGRSLFLGSIVSIAYFVVLNQGSWSSFSVDWNVIGVVLVTAMVEEMTFSGFVAGYLERVQKGRWINYLIVGLMVAVIRLPILVFVHGATNKEIIGVMLIAFASGVINAWIRIRSGNVAGSILARLGMNLAALG
ncbi:MAG TPA: hypothetical protein PLI45_04005 [Candidatus Woesebacteria bacterium]|nr:hypothetical protein [Candidatus Woesebacteria bacterium]